MAFVISALLLFTATTNSQETLETPFGTENYALYKSEELPLIRATLGGYSTIIQTQSNQVYQWGIDHGQRNLSFPEDIRTLSCGGYHCLALSDSGAVYEWGQRDSSQQKETKPHLVPGLVGLNFVKISAGFRHNIAITDNGKVYVWGETLNGKVAHPHASEDHLPPTKLTDIPPVVDGACGGDHTILVTEDGSLWSFGSNSDGQLGRHSSDSFCSTPKPLQCDHKIVAMSVGGDHTLLLSDSNKIYSFGWGNMGQLGHGDTQNVHSPKEIQLPEGETPVQVAAGAYGHSLIRTIEGHVYAFGMNDFGQLGFAAGEEAVITPQKVDLPEAHEVLGGGFKHSGVLTTGGDLILFGDDSFGPKGLTSGQQWPETLVDPSLFETILTQ